ncbi:DNA-binding transcriptional regulator YhcF (GntR family) [Sphingobium xenophagum]|uniref:DNA-binding transcriptional regulator YhcF (GntR family) n=1 Tax=Sphingobium xenophagum TaxID=121428 RepID=A0ABU1X2I2_SPHXE|nr:GntR family transcriptional regulator [Sphingobium xenophagum]MDR7155783.1 DNA-binding transcriptional regulator YhcF (GntR family) [Sphingobium xenophagum]
MSAEPITADRIYRRLKQDILDGILKPGAPLVVQALADHYGVSISPVRDSAHQLVGEQILAANQGGGFIVPPVTADMLRDLYTWHGYLVRHALKAKAPYHGDLEPIKALERHGPVHPRELRDAANSLFSFIGSRPKNAVHARAIIMAGDRLAVARLHEPLVFDNVQEELLSISNLTEIGRDAAVREAIWAYHRRRIRRASIVAHQIVSNISSFNTPK